jgi:hypothetical protein
MIERINELAARFGGGIGRTKWSFVRIHLWTLTFLVVISLLAPSKTGTLALPPTNADAPVRSLALGLNDQRAFAPSPFGKDRFRIAWITGSEGEVLRQGLTQGQFLASSATQSLPEIDGRKVAGEVYYFPAMRLADAYFALLDAIKTKPDMIVMSLNPVWTLDPIATQQWTQLDPKAARQLLTKPNAWPIGASLLSPSDLMWGIASELQPIKDRSSYSDDIHSLVDDLGPLDRSDLARATGAQQQSLYQQILSRPPPNFWFPYRLHLTDRVPNARGWARWIAQSNTGENALNKMLLRATATALRDSKIPSYVYLAQINRRFLTESKAVGNAIAGVERQLKQLRGDFTGPAILYRPKTATRFVRGQLAFRNLDRDPVHLSRADAMGPYLAKQLCLLAMQVGDQTTCT